MKVTTLTLFMCMVLSGCCVPSVRADTATEETSRRANQLLEISFGQNRDNHPLAIRTAQQALSLFQSVNDVQGIANTHERLGLYHMAENSLAESERHLNLALKSWRQLSNLRKQAEALVYLGYVEARRGEWLNGVSYLTQAHNLISQQREPRLMGQIASGIAYLFNDSGLPESALEQYRRAIEYYRDGGEPRGEINMLALLGYSYFLLQNYPAALAHLEQALAKYDAFPNPSAIRLDKAECLEYLGQVYIATGQHERALQHLQPLLGIYKDSSNRKELGHIKALIGQIYERQGAVSRARSSYLEASRIFREVADPLNDGSVRFALGRLELNSGNYEAAENYLKDSIENTENIRRDLKTRVFAAAFSARVHERYEAYIECLIRKHKSQPSTGLDVLAFEASELARARSLAELLRDTQTTALVGVDPQLAQREKSLRHEIRTTVDDTVALLATAYKKEDLDRFEGLLTRLREQHKQVTAQLRRSNPDYDKIEEPTSYSLQQIQNTVLEDDQTVLLEYLLGQNASYVWAITRKSVKVFELPKADVITSVVRRVYEDVAKEPDDENSKQLSNATAELAEMVLRPVAAELNAQRLIVVADGALNYIPFQLLPNPSANNEPLVAKFEVINAPSASILGQLRQEQRLRRARTKVLAAFGDPVFASNYAQYKASGAGELTASARGIEVSGDNFDASTIQPLSYTKFELNNLSAIAGSGAFVARGFAASRDMLSSMDLSKFAILHFATHGVLNPDKPEHSGFYLSTVDTEGHRQDGFINMQDVYRLNAPVDLVVLSACRTGLGQEVRGEGLIGLTRGFMFAGASSVVSSLWKVDDEATSELMKYFYANMLQKGMRPAEALRAAQNMLRQDPKWESPHYWAAFTLQGEFRQPIKLPEAKGASPLVQNTVGAGLLTMLLAGIGWGFWRRRG